MGADAADVGEHRAAIRPVELGEGLLVIDCAAGCLFVCSVV